MEKVRKHTFVDYLLQAVAALGEFMYDIALLYVMLTVTFGIGAAFGLQTKTFYLAVQYVLLGRAEILSLLFALSFATLVLTKVSRGLRDD